MKSGILNNKGKGYQEDRLDSSIKSNSILVKIETRNQGDSDSQIKGSILNNEGKREEAEAIRIDS
jgi:hypothetical protein